MEKKMSCCGTAVIEMSGAAGITLVSEKDRNPMYTTTYGVGEVIRDAVQKGCRKFIIGIGRSATNDGGIEMLQALGYGFLNAGVSRFLLEPEDSLSLRGLRTPACFRN